MKIATCLPVIKTVFGEIAVNSTYVTFLFKFNRCTGNTDFSEYRSVTTGTGKPISSAFPCLSIATGAVPNTC
jgi:hypothetical protein